ncbi:heme-thiolate peroxidase [Neopestalotiopsis clavispora]|nr:heme-thiolate peroxidase [Neopestalotiopsis clavispora]
MLAALPFVFALLSTALADPEGHEWQAPGDSDSRAPCPMLNSLANHGYLPRDGLNIDADTLTQALSDGINIDPTTLAGAVQAAVSLSTTGNSSTFHLHDTLKHNAIEHDGSMSRDDVYNGGDALHFNATVWAQTTALFTEDTISLETAALARAARIAKAKEANPEYDAINNSSAGLGETALYEITFGDRVEGNAPTEWVKIFFEQERLPFAEGYTRPESPIMGDELSVMIGKITDASPIESIE